MRTLWGLHYSPWTEKARWALDHHRVDYRYREHMPLLGEPGLRWRSRRRAPDTPASVPMLLDTDTVLGDSTDIARFAERIGRGTPLFAPELEHGIDHWIRASDRALASARALVVDGLLSSPAAQAESLPGPLPRSLRPALRGVARVGSHFIARKYGAELDASSQHLHTLDEFCRSLSDALDGPHVLAQSSYADFCCAVVVNAFSPLRQRFFATTPATAEVWTRPELIERYPQLIFWRDQLYEARGG